MRILPVPPVLGPVHSRVNAACSRRELIEVSESCEQAPRIGCGPDPTGKDGGRRGLCQQPDNPSERNFARPLKGGSRECGELRNYDPGYFDTAGSGISQRGYNR
jgi:hypothetical protein